MGEKEKWIPRALQENAWQGAWSTWDQVAARGFIDRKAVWVPPAVELGRAVVGFIVARRRWFCVLAQIILFVACLSRYWMRYDPADSFRLGPEPRLLAHTLYEKKEFSNPFVVLDTGPSAIMGPVFPAFMALLMKMFGDQSAGMQAVKVSAALIVALQVALFPAFSRKLGMGEWNGVLAASIWILAKPRLVYGWDVHYVAFLFAVACCLYRRGLDAPPGESSKRLWLLGCLEGVLILVSPAVASTFAAWLAWEIWRRKAAFLKVSLLPLVLLPAMILAPWTVRNYLIFHRFILVRDNLGLELASSNNDCAQFSQFWNESTRCAVKVHPGGNAKEAERVRELGEANYNEVRLREAAQWIKSHPARFLKLSVQRCVAFWMPTETLTIHYAGTGRRMERVIIYLMTLLSGAGLMILYRRDVKSAAVCLSCLAIYPLVYYVVHFEYRFRYPIMWVTFLLGAVPITECVRRLWETFSRKVLDAAALNERVGGLLLYNIPPGVKLSGENCH